jgi:hypothetical protein
MKILLLLQTLPIDVIQDPFGIPSYLVSLSTPGKKFISESQRRIIFKDLLPNWKKYAHEGQAATYAAASCIPGNEGVMQMRRFIRCMPISPITQNFISSTNQSHRRLHTCFGRRDSREQDP